MISSPSGLSRNVKSLLGVRVTTRGSRLWNSIPGDATIGTIDSEAWERIAGYYFGTSMLECCIDPRLYVKYLIIPCVRYTDQLNQASVRQRGSVSSHHPLLRNRTESQATMRLRSDSSLTSNSVDEEELIEHSVESRTRTAELPPVMVSVILCLVYSFTC